MSLRVYKDMTDSKNKYIFKNTLIFFVSSFATKLLSFFFVPLYTYVLSEAEYGTADIITTTTTLLVYIFTLNIGDAVLRFTIERREYSRNILSYGLRVILIGAAVCAVCVGLIGCFRVMGYEYYCYVFLFLYFLSNAFQGIISSYARGMDKVLQVGISGIISTAVFILCNILFLVVYPLNLFGYLMSGVISSISTILYLCIALKIPLFKIFIKETCSKDTRKKMVAYSVPLIFNSIAWWLNSAFDKYSITYIIGVDQNGLYSVASKIPLIIATISTVFGQAWSLSVIKDVDADDKDGFFSKSYDMYNFVLAAMGSVLIGLNIPLAHILFLKDFFPAWQFSSILIISAIFSALSSHLGGAFTKVMKTDIYAKTSIVSTVVNIVLNVIFINLIGMIGAAIATAISFVVLWLIRFIWARKYVKIRVSLVKHVISYLILIAQIVIEHFIREFSAFQILFIFIMIIIYNIELKELFAFGIKTARKVFKRRK